MNKKEIINELLRQLKDELEKAKAAYLSAKSTTQDADNKAESKWDTRSIEAGYLAGAQKVRVDELEMDIGVIEELGEAPLDKRETVGIGSLVEIKHNDVTRKYFIASAAGGYMINLDGDVVLVISVFSPIGNEVLDLDSGDSFEIEAGGNLREYEVISHS